MRATRWIGGISLALALASGVFASTAQASVDGEGDPISGVDGRNAPVMVNPEQLAAWRLERLGARVKYDESKIDRPVIEVDLSGCPMSEPVLEELTALPNLCYLNLKGVKLSDTHLKRLANLRHLQKIVLENTGATLLDAEDLLKAIPELSVDFGPHARQIGYFPPPTIVP